MYWKKNFCKCNPCSSQNLIFMWIGAPYFASSMMRFFLSRRRALYVVILHHWHYKIFCKMVVVAIFAAAWWSNIFVRVACSQYLMLLSFLGQYTWCITRRKPVALYSMH